MKTKLARMKRLTTLLALLSIAHFHPSTMFAQGTAFTYQGRLNDGANPANGSYDLRFIVFDNSAGGNQQGPILTNSATGVSNGLFTVALDFGNQFPGASRWLEIAVRTNGVGSFFTLSSRQAITPAPYAITAGSVVSSGLTGTYGNTVTFNNANNNFSGAFTGNGANVTNVNAATLGGLSPAGFWKSAGNAGTTPGTHFMGTTDNQPLELKINGTRALRLEPTINDANHSNIVNLIGGSALNYVSNGVIGATVSGGGAGNLFGSAYINSVTSDFGTVGGGLQNTSGPFATVGGGSGNTASGTSATVSGGSLNTASGTSAIIPGGDQCTATGDWSFAAGLRAHANHNGAFVWADPGGVGFTSTGVNQFLIRAAGGVGIGLNNPASQLHVSSAGGNPQLQITQTTTTDYARLRMNVLGSPSWEMDVSPGATPGISWWTGSVKMNLDYNGNLTTVGTVNGSSDRNLKEHFSPVSSREVLDKVSSLPITEWNYKTDGTALRHIGPMAQDFYAAFNVGTDDKHISMVDADGVALAAIQGLNQKLTEQDVVLKDQGSEIQKLRQVIVELQETVCKATNKTQE
jgi:Chaperone of endosialidase